jgi:hypothetical protein
MVVEGMMSVVAAVSAMGVACLHRACCAARR